MGTACPVREAILEKTATVPAPALTECATLGLMAVACACHVTWDTSAVTVNSCAHAKMESVMMVRCKVGGAVVV